MTSQPRYSQISRLTVAVLLAMASLSCAAQTQNQKGQLPVRSTLAAARQERSHAFVPVQLRRSGRPKKKLQPGI